MTPRQRIHATVKEFLGRCEARMVEGRKRVVAVDGVFLKQLSTRQLLEGALRNLNQLQGPALNPQAPFDPERTYTSGTDTCNYVMTLCERLEEIAMGKMAEEVGPDIE